MVGCRNPSQLEAVMRPTPTRHPWWVPLARLAATGLLPALLGAVVLWGTLGLLAGAAQTLTTAIEAVAP